MKIKETISEERIDQSVRRLLRMKFQLGLFDNPFVDPEQVGKVFGKPESIKAGIASQSRAMVLLQNDEKCLPLKGDSKIFVQNIDPEINAAAKGLLVEFGACDQAVLNNVFGKTLPKGKLPFE